MVLLESAVQTPGRPSGQPAAGRTAEALAAAGRIRDSLARITEALSFQDLSGQRLLKVMKILRQVQAQVLTLLVATGHQLKLVEAGQEISLQECEALAQEELIRAIHYPPPAESAEAFQQSPAHQEPLDQEAINALLAGLGF
jgi:hypothetical protein